MALSLYPRESIVRSSSKIANTFLAFLFGFLIFICFDKEICNFAPSYPLEIWYPVNRYFSSLVEWPRLFSLFFF